MSSLVRILHLEDNPNDAELVQAMLAEDGLACEVVRVENSAEFDAALDRERFDLIVSDFTLPSYDGRSALILAKAKCPDMPVLFFSGTLGEESAIQVLRDGATDYILKQRPARFAQAVRRALHEAEEHAARMRSEKAMREAQERFIGIYESSKDAIAYLTLDGLLLDVNDSFVKLTGYAREELLTKTYQDLTPTEYRKFEADIIHKVIGTGEPAEYEKECLRKDGSRVSISLTAFVVKNREGRPDGLAAIIKDSTERKQTEEKLLLQNTALEASANGIIITDRNGTIIWANAAFTAMTGYSLGEAVGQNPRLLKSGIQGSSFYTNLWSTITSGRSWHGELVNKRKDGTFFTEEQTITPVRDARGGITHFIAIKYDITERKRLEEQFRQAQKMEAVGQLTGGIAHDFNNLLTVINGYSELTLQLLKADDPLRGNVEQVKQAGERAAALTRQLLAFSRKQVLEPKVLDLNAVVTNIEKMLTRTIGEDIALVHVLKPGLGRVKADPGQIEQVIMNLAVNARDAMPQGGKLTIETANVELDENFTRKHVVVKPGQYVMLAVSDTGCGMDAKTQRHIFEPFFTTKEKGRGTGLGLATVYGIVKQSGGSIWVYSEVGRGTTFKVYLPRVEKEPDTVLPDAVRAASLKGSETILLVEDDAPLRKLMLSILRHGGYHALEASDRGTAFQLCDQHDGPIHLMLTDVVMPGMSGQEAAQRLATTRPDMKVLFMSGYTDDTIVRHGVLSEGVAFLQKPFTADGLLRKVREVLDADKMTD